MNNESVKCIAYLSADCRLSEVGKRENAQLRQIKEYAATHGMVITEVVRRNAMSAFEVRKQINRMAQDIRSKKADTVLIVRMSNVTDDIATAYSYAGVIAAAGGKIIAVHSGPLTLTL